MTHTRFESISLLALEHVAGGVDDGASAITTDDRSESERGGFTTGGSFGAGSRDKFTTGGSFGAGSRDKFTTGGSFGGGSRDKFTTGGTIGGDGTFTTGGSF